MKYRKNAKSIAILLVAVMILSSVLSGCMAIGTAIGTWMKGKTEVTESTATVESKETTGKETSEEPETEDVPYTEPVIEQGDSLVFYEKPDSSSYNRDFVDFTNRVLGEILDGNTINIHFTLKNPENYGLDPALATWGSFDLSDEALQEYSDTMRDYLETLEGFDYDSLNWDEQICYDSLKWYAENELFSEGMDLYYEPLGPTNGLQANYPVYLAVYAFDCEQDVENYLNLLMDYPRLFEDVMAFEEMKKEAGLFMEDELLRQTIEQCEDFLESQEDSFLYITFDERVDKLQLDAATAEEYKKTNREYVDEYIYPTYEYLMEELGKYYGSCKYEGGLCHKPEGKKYYEYLLRSSTGSSMTPDEMIELLETKITKYMGQLRRQYLENQFIFDELEGIDYPTKDPNLLMRMLIDLVKEDYPELDDVDYNIQYIDKSLRDYLSPACYFLPQVDAPNVNNIFINCDKGDEEEDLFITMAHEGYPGHLFQSNYALSNSELPLRFEIATSGYAEGWAEYVESNSYRYIEGVSEELADFAYADLTLSLCIYARTDLGIHYEGWGLDEVNEFVEEYYGEDPEAAEWMYYYIMEDAGGYLDYCIGQQEIEMLYERARSGGDVTEAEFNKTLLDLSGAPFEIIKKFMFE